MTIQLETIVVLSQQRIEGLPFLITNDSLIPGMKPARKKYWGIMR